MSRSARRDGSLRQGNSRDAAHPPHEGVRHLDEDPRAVAGAAVGRDRAPVGEIVEELERFDDDVAGTHAVDVGDEPNSTRVVLVSRVVQSLLFRHLVPGAFAPVGAAGTKKRPLPIWRGPSAL
jgi:hypothetical protein